MLKKQALIATHYVTTMDQDFLITQKNGLAAFITPENKHIIIKLKTRQPTTNQQINKSTLNH